MLLSARNAFAVVLVAGVAAALLAISPPPAGAAATTYYYKETFRATHTSPFGGRLRWNISNWMHVQDCGGVTNNNCGQRTYEISGNTGNRIYTNYLSGRGWVGTDHPRMWTRPYCEHYYYAGQYPLTNCYQLYYN